MTGFYDPWADEILPPDAVLACRAAVAECDPFFDDLVMLDEVDTILGAARCEEIGEERIRKELDRLVTNREINQPNTNQRRN